MPNKTNTTIQMWNRTHQDLIDLKRQPALIFLADGFLEVEWDIDGQGVSIPVKDIFRAITKQTEEPE